jgi:stress-induced morphogen
MGIGRGELENLIKVKFPEATFELIALVDDGEHYELKITSSKFANLSKVNQHKLVYETLGIMDNRLHALSLKTFVQ